MYISSVNLRKISQKEMEKTAEILKKFSANTIHAPFLDISPGGFDKDIRRISFEKLKMILKIAKRWKSKLIVMHFNYDPIYYREYLEPWLDNASDFFSDLAKEKNIPFIALENISEFTPYIVLELVNRIGSDKIIHCFDFGHHNVFGSVSFEEWLFYLKPENHIHFHFHDNTGLYDDHLPLGEGNIDWERVKSVISDFDVDFSVALEPHSKKDSVTTTRNYRKMFL